MLYRKSKHMFYIQKLFPPENRVVYDIMSKNMVEPERTQKMLRPRVSYWISKPTHAQARACAPAPIPTDTRKHIHTHGRTHTYACLHPHSRARAHTHTHTHTHRNMEYWLLSTATMIQRTLLNILLYVHCLHCCEIICVIDGDTKEYMLMWHTEDMKCL